MEIIIRCCLDVLRKSSLLSSRASSSGRSCPCRAKKAKHRVAPAFGFRHRQEHQGQDLALGWVAAVPSVRGGSSDFGRGAAEAPGHWSHPPGASLEIEDELEKTRTR